MLRNLALLVLRNGVALLLLRRIMSRVDDGAVDQVRGGRGFTRSSRPRGTLFNSLTNIALGSALTLWPVNSMRVPWGDGFGVWRGRALPFLAARSAANCFMAEFIVVSEIRRVQLRD